MKVKGIQSERDLSVIRPLHCTGSQPVSTKEVSQDHESERHSD